MLPRLVGLGKAMELLQTGAIIDAEEALRIGLVNRVVPHDELEAETYALAEQLARGPSHAHGLMKRMVYRGMESSFQELLDFEAAHQATEMDHPDHLEAASAFLEKREAQYR
jgi:2-(1,2-epoxy-1,2-dihydrophenyl)acetyl-CoA isomerase